MIGDNITYKPYGIGSRLFILVTIIEFLFFTIMIIVTRDLVFLLCILCSVILFYYAFPLAKVRHTKLVFTDEGITVREKGKDDVFYSWEDLPYAGYMSYRGLYFYYTNSCLILSAKELSDDEKKRILRLYVGYPLGENGVFVFYPQASIRNTREVVELIEKRYGLKNRY